MGPLTVSDVLANSCLLSWEHPVDNGGDEIMGYRIEKMDKKTEEWEKVRLVIYI